MEIISAPHHELSYDEGIRRDVNSFTIEEIRGFDKQAAVQYARAIGLQETGMSVNEIALLYDLLEKKSGPISIVELGRNFACSTRIFVQRVVRGGGFLESWDLKHWGNVIESFKNQGFKIIQRPMESLNAGTTPENNEPDYCLTIPDGPAIAELRVADSRRTHISPTTRWVDFLLIDTEHGIEDALGEYMRWRTFLKGGALVAFHDSTLPGVARAIELAIEVEDQSSPGRIVRKYVNEREDGFGIAILEWKG